MKNTFKALLLATTAAAAPVFAATTTNTFDAGDILLGFYTATGTGATQNLVVNLGSYSQFDNNDGQTFSFSASIVADLVATYGSNWNSRTDIKWAVTGTTGSTSLDGITRSTIFSDSPRATLGASPVSIASNTEASLAQVRAPILSIGTAFNMLDTTANSSVSVVIAGSNADSFWTRQQLNSGPQFADANNNLTTGTSISDFYAVVPTSGGAALTGLAIDSDGVVFARGTNYLGYFTLSSTGLSFTGSGSAIPEPSAYGAIAGVLALACVAGRRRSRQG